MSTADAGGVLIGGTFTDLVALDPDRRTASVEKVPSTPSSPARRRPPGRPSRVRDAVGVRADYGLAVGGAITDRRRAAGE